MRLARELIFAIRSVVAKGVYCSRASQHLSTVGRAFGDEVFLAGFHSDSIPLQ